MRSLKPRAEVTCPETPSWKEIELDLYCGPPDSRAHVLCSVPHISNGSGMEGRGAKSEVRKMPSLSFPSPLGPEPS